MSSKVKKGLQICGLLLAIFVSFATSTLGDRITPATYTVTSDCPDAQTSGSLTWKWDESFEESALDYGFPSVTKSGEHNKMIVFQGETRECKAVFFDGEQSRNYVFVCHNVQSGDLECTITLDYQKDLEYTADSGSTGSS